MRLLVTRPEEDGAALEARLKDFGHEALCAPLLTIRYHPEKPLKRAGAQALLATSANGIRAFARRADLSAWQDVPLLAVGPTTAALAAEAGFKTVLEGEGDAKALAALARARCVPGAGRLIHISGAVIAGDLKAWLEADGFEVERAVLYEAAGADTFPAEAAEALRAGRIEGVLFYSRRTGEIFRRLCEEEGLTDFLASACAYCLAPSIREVLEGLPFRDFAVAGAPNEDALLDLLA